jgi:hypothetical protein
MPHPDLKHANLLLALAEEMERTPAGMADEASLHALDRRLRNLAAAFGGGTSVVDVPAFRAWMADQADLLRSAPTKLRPREDVSAGAYRGGSTGEGCKFEIRLPADFARGTEADAHLLLVGLHPSAVPSLVYPTRGSPLSDCGALRRLHAGTRHPILVDSDGPLPSRALWLASAVSPAPLVQGRDVETWNNWLESSGPSLRPVAVCEVAMA